MCYGTPGWPSTDAVINAPDDAPGMKAFARTEAQMQGKPTNPSPGPSSIAPQQGTPQGAQAPPGAPSPSAGPSMDAPRALTPRRAVLEPSPLGGVTGGGMGGGGTGIKM